MIIITPGLLALIFLSLAFVPSIVAAFESRPGHYDQRRPWRRPFVLRCLTESQERISGIALAVCLALTAGFVLTALILPWIG